jgi:hypothetical protein
MKCCSFIWELPSQLNLKTAEAALFMVLTLLLQRLACNPNTQEKPANIEKTMI